jgi:hypothetical protein
LKQDDLDVWVKTPDVVVEETDLACFAGIKVTPLPDGRNYIDWFTQSKAIRQVEGALNELAQEMRRS